mgnify:CR=1 FL=1
MDRKLGAIELKHRLEMRRFVRRIELLENQKEQDNITINKLMAQIYDLNIRVNEIEEFRGSFDNNIGFGG